MLCQQHWWLVPSWFFIIFFLWRFLLQKPLANLPVLRDPRRLTFVLSFSKASRFHLFRPTFWLLFFLSFSQVSWFLSARLKDLQPPSFMVFLLGFHKVLGSYSWIVGSQAFWSFFCIIGWLIGTYLFLFLVFSWHASLNCLNPNLALLHVSRIPGSWESLGILA